MQLLLALENENRSTESYSKGIALFLESK